jgi:hypothetical protein
LVGCDEILLSITVEVTDRDITGERISVIRPDTEDGWIDLGAQRCFDEHCQDKSRHARKGSLDHGNSSVANQYPAYFPQKAFPLRSRAIRDGNPFQASAGLGLTLEPRM